MSDPVLALLLKKRGAPADGPDDAGSDDRDGADDVQVQAAAELLDALRTRDPAAVATAFKTMLDTVKAPDDTR